jgi:hypothetical protein
MAFRLGGAVVCIRATRVPQLDRSNVTGLESARPVLSRAPWHDADRWVAQNGLRLLWDLLAHREDLMERILMHPRGLVEPPGRLFFWS